MRARRSIIWGAIYTMIAGTISTPALAQAIPTVESLQASAKVYAGTDWAGTYQRLCIPGISAANQVRPTINPALYPSGDLPTPPGGTPPRENWYSPPAQIGDNLYFLGTRNHSTYALVSKKGEIILLDGNFEYATVDEIHKGLQFLGLDPSKVRYQIIAHAHGDHDGGAHLTERAIPGVTIVYGEGDWPSVLARTVPHATRFGPQNDGTDGRIIQVGDVSVRIVTMPGHTPGTLSFLFEFKDRRGEEPIRVAFVGGTAISFTNPDPAFYDQYIASSQKFARAAAAFGATALMSNHTEFDNAYFRANTAAMLRVLRDEDQGGQNNRRGNRQGNDRNEANVPEVPNRFLRDVPNPYEVGQREVLNYFAVVELCAKAAKLRATGVL
jgi:metallo-beta-lactamase class B